MSDKPPVNLFDKASRVLPNPFTMFMHPLCIPFILAIVVLIYLSGQGKLLLSNFPIVCGGLGFIFMLFIIVILYKKPSWHNIKNEYDEDF